MRQKAGLVSHLPLGLAGVAAMAVLGFVLGRASGAPPATLSTSPVQGLAPQQGPALSDVLPRGGSGGPAPLTIRPARNAAPPPNGVSAINSAQTWDELGKPIAVMYYVTPNHGPVKTWRWTALNGYVAGGTLAPFTNISVSRFLPGTQFAEGRLVNDEIVFVEARRLTIGGQEEAHREYCLNADGSPVSNNEFLGRSGSGSHQITVSNMGSGPAVANMRAATGHVAASVYVDANSSAVIRNFPSGNYRLEFTFGKVWSRKCRRFFGDRRTQRFPEFDSFVSTWSQDAGMMYEHYKLAQYVITPVRDGNVHAIEMDDEDFLIE